MTNRIANPDLAAVSVSFPAGERRGGSDHEGKIGREAAAHVAQGEPAKAHPAYETKPRPSISHQRDWDEAQERAHLCEQFLQLTSAEGGHSLRHAAAQLGKSPSWFSGADSMLARYRRGGVAALLPQASDPSGRAQGAKPGELSEQVESLGWFIPAAQFFYLLSNRSWDRGSMAEAIRRTISLPHLPRGWKESDKTRFLKKLDLDAAPVCPDELREALLAREQAGQPFVPQSIARQITLNRATVRQFRNPREASLDFLNSPGGMRLFRDAITGEMRLARAGEIIEADDATINFPVCVPWNRDGSDDPCVSKFGVKVARFQWLVSIDVGTSFITGFSYTARPRSSYRAEDIVSLMRVITRAHGAPRYWRFERGTWESKLVKEVIRLMGCRLETVYSPHQKPFIEGLFNVLWTKLSVNFPGAHVGRFRGEEKSASDLLTACQRGDKDPRRYFPMLNVALEVFREVIAEKNLTPVNSENHGRWIPEQRWQAEAQGPNAALRRLDGASEWMFSPFVRQWRVNGMLVGGRVPLFEGLSVPFDFSAPWLTRFNGAHVKCHFDPADAKCSAMIVLAERFDGHHAGEVLGPARQISQAAEYARLVMGWGDSPETEGLKARQQAAAALRREVRAVMPRGERGEAVSEERDGIATVTRIETGGTPATPPSEPQPEKDVEPASREQLEARDRQREEFFEENPLDFV